MNIKKFAKRATVLTFTTALLAGGATQAFAKENTQNLTKKRTASLISHAMICCRSLNSSKVKNTKCLNSTHQQLKISSPRKDWMCGTAGRSKTLTEQYAEYNGYHVVFALAGSPKDADDTSIYMFYQKSATTRSTAGKTRAVSLKTAISSTPTMKS